MSASDNRQLSTREQERFAACEEIIRKGLRTFREVGEALAEIRDKKWYRARFKTFEEYCRHEWRWTARRARQLIDAAEVVANLEDDKMGTPVPIPTSEKQVRSLVGLPPSQQRETWKLATKDSPQPSDVTSLVQRAKSGVSAKIEIRDDELPLSGSSEEFSPEEQEAIAKIGGLCGEAIAKALRDRNPKIAGRKIVRWSKESKPVIKGLVYYLIYQGWKDFDAAVESARRDVVEGRVRIIEAEGPKVDAKEEADKLSPEEIKCKELLEQVTRLCCAEVLEAFKRRDSFEAKQTFTTRLYEVLPPLLPYGVPVPLSLHETDAAPESGPQAPLYEDQAANRGHKGPASIAVAHVAIPERAVSRLTQEAAALQYLERIAGMLRGEKRLREFSERLREGEILTRPDDLKRFATLDRDRMKQLFEHVLKTSTFKEAQNREAEEGQES